MPLLRSSSEQDDFGSINISSLRDEIACTGPSVVRLFLSGSSRLSLPLISNSQSKGSTHGSRSSTRKAADAGAIVRHFQCVSTNSGNQDRNRTRSLHRDR